MKINRLAIIPVLALMPLLTSCGKVPQAELDAANAAVEAAKNVQANLYVAEEFQALQDSMNAVVAAIETEKSKLFKNFKEETEKLNAIVNQASVVSTNAQTKKQEMKVQTESLITEIQAVMTQNEELFAKAPKGKEGKAALEVIRGELDVITAGITEAQTLLANDDVINAMNKAQALKAQADERNAELADVIAKVRRR